MSFVNSNDESFDKLKELWDEYGKFFIATIIIAILLIFAYKFWQKKHNVHFEKSSHEYNQLLNKLNENPNDLSFLQTFSENTKNIYGDFAKFELINAFIKKNDFENAQKNLESLVKSTKDKQIKNLAQIRLARVYLETKSYENALEILNEIKDKIWFFMRDELKADVFVGQKKTSDAEQIYLQLLKSENLSLEQSERLKIKLGNLVLPELEKPKETDSK